MTITVEVKRILYTSESLKIFVGWYDDLSISFRCRGTLTFEPREKQKITLTGQFHPEMGDQVFFFHQGEEFIAMDVKRAFIELTEKRETKHNQKKEPKDMATQKEIQFALDCIGIKTATEKYNIPSDYIGAARFVADHIHQYELTAAVKESNDIHAHNYGSTLDEKWICTYALRILWYERGSEFTDRLTNKFRNRWNVYHAGEFYAATIAVSAEKACNNVRWRFIRDKGRDDGAWSAVPAELPWYDKHQQNGGER